MNLSLVSLWANNLRTSAAAVERVLVSPDEKRWTNSLALWILANALDLLVTWQGLLIGGIEVNPILSSALSAHGELSMYAIKMSLAVLGGLVVWRYGTTRIKGLLNLGMILIVIVNCALLVHPMWHLKGIL